MAVPHFVAFVCIRYMPKRHLVLPTELNFIRISKYFKLLVLNFVCSGYHMHFTEAMYVVQHRFGPELNSKVQLHLVFGSRLLKSAQSTIL